MTFQDLTCQELVELITDYIEEMLPAVERARFEAHLALCTGCRNYLVQTQRTIRVLGVLSEDSIASAVRDELLGVFRNWKRG